jgi:hypothetical protein
VASSASSIPSRNADDLDASATASSRGQVVVDVANAWWNQGNPCPEGIGVENIPLDAGAQAWPGWCKVDISTGMYPKPAYLAQDVWEASMCHLMVHEYGHLLGHDHEPSGIMTENDMTYGVRVCPIPTWFTGPFYGPTPLLNPVGAYTRSEDASSDLDNDPVFTTRKKAKKAKHPCRKYKKHHKRKYRKCLRKHRKHRRRK